MNAWNVIAPVIAAGGLSAWGAFHPRSQMFGPLVRTAGSACALTFDDGPNPRITPRLLGLLEKYRVPATFFVIGKYVSEYPTLAAEIAAANHTIGNHTYTHRSLVFLRRRDITDELNRCQDAIFNATGRPTLCARPPFGFRGPQFYRAALEAGLSTIVSWSVNGRDWKPQLAQNVGGRLSKAHAGDIILLHDGDHRTSNADRGHMLDALEIWLPRWMESGVRFISL